jgi:2-keto-3-deoxy-L-rhamnonate aldolase RhmA
VGPSDLAPSLGLGHVNFEKNSRHQSSIRKVVQISGALGKFSYIHCATVDEAKERADQGSIPSILAATSTFSSRRRKVYWRTYANN